MKLTTTLNRIRACSPCGLKPNPDGTLKGYQKLAAFLGADFNPEEEFNLLRVLDSNGVQDMLWCLRTTLQDPKKIASQLAIEFAEQVLPIFEARYPDDKRPRAAIQTAKDFNAGIISTEELRTAQRAAADAADAADADAAYAAAAYAAYAAYDAAAADAYAYAAAADAYAAAADAADAADARKTMLEKQADIIRMILEA